MKKRDQDKVDATRWLIKEYIKHAGSITTAEAVKLLAVSSERASATLAAMYTAKKLKRVLIKKEKNSGSGRQETYEYFLMGLDPKRQKKSDKEAAEALRKVPGLLAIESLSVPELSIRMGCSLFTARRAVDLLEKGRVISVVDRTAGKMLFGLDKLIVKNHPLDFSPEESISRLLDQCVMNAYKAVQRHRRAA